MSLLSSVWSPIQHAIGEFCKALVFHLAQQDGKDGLSFADFERLVQWIRMASTMGTLSENSEKHQHVVELVKKYFGDKVPAWCIEMVVGLAYQYAKKKGLV